MNLIPIESPCFIQPELLAAMPDWAAMFEDDAPLILEIGCGVGDFVTKMAQQNLNWNFIAADYYNKGCLKTCKRIDKAGLKNVRVVRDEARSFITRCISPGSLRGVIINCPDPWPKLRHRKRRLVNPEFLGFISEFMQPGADFYFATDFDDYGEDVAAMMPTVPGFRNILAPDHYRYQLEGYPLSKYMLKFMGEGKQIYFIHYRKLS